jgi:hypothetical protein
LRPASPAVASADRRRGILFRQDGCHERSACAGTHEGFFFGPDVLFFCSEHVLAVVV